MIEIKTIQKRNGTIVPFTPDKITAAIKKAFVASNWDNEDDVLDAYLTVLTAKVIKRLEEANEASIAIENVQDAVEYTLMESGEYQIARAYVRYRHRREMARKANTTDAKILSLIDCCNQDAKDENSNKNPVINSTQRDYMAGEVSRDLTERILLPADIVEAHKAGIIHFHDTDYFAQKMVNCCLINLDDMFHNGTVITGTRIDTPHSFYTACNITTQIVAQVASNQYGLR